MYWISTLTPDIILKLDLYIFHVFQFSCGKYLYNSLFSDMATCEGVGVNRYVSVGEGGWWMGWSGQGWGSGVDASLPKILLLNFYPNLKQNSIPINARLKTKPVD